MASEGNTGMLYALCAIAAIGVLLNVILVFWQIFTYNLERGFRFVKGALILLDVFYTLTGLAVIFLLLYKDVGVPFLCTAGGFLVLFATQEAVWILATSCVSLLLWRRKSLSKDFQRRNVTIFLLIVCAEGLVLLTVSILPFTNLPYFDSHSDYYFLCAPFRLPGEQGWAFSTLVIILDWIALGVSVATLAVVSVRYSTCNDNAQLSPAEKLSEGRSDTRRVQRQLFLSLVAGAAGWSTVLVLVSISYFAKGRIDKGAVQWILGFCISATLIVHVLTFVLHTVVTRWLRRRRGGNQDPTGLKELVESCPKALDGAQRQAGGQKDSGIALFLVRWRDTHGRLLTGSMKVFSPNAADRWRREVNAVAQIGALSHPNVAPYLWLNPSNRFSTFLQTSTRHVVSRKSLVLCRLHYPNGTLQSFLQGRVHQLTEIGLHKVTLDVATGLEFLHQHHLVHNGLTTHAVYMASVSEKIGLKAVIGDLENCHEVPPGTHENGEKPPTSPGSQVRDLFAITGTLQDTAGTQLANNRFAPDIRAFGTIVLEMLVAMAEHNQKRRGRFKTSSRASCDVRMCTESMRSLDDAAAVMHAARDESVFEADEPDSVDADRQEAQDENAHHHDGNHPCSCSTKVTDVRARACRTKNNSLKLDILGRNLTHRDDVHDEVRFGEHASKTSSHSQCVDCGKFQKQADSPSNVVEYMNQAIPGIRYRARAWDLSPRDTDIALDDMNVSQESMSLSVDSEYSPRSDGTSESSADFPLSQEGRAAQDSQEKTRKANHLLATLPFLPFQRPKPPAPESSGSDTDTSLDHRSASSNGPPRASPRRGAHKQILTNGSFLATPRSTPEFRPPSRPRKTDACTDTADFGDFDSNESLRSAGVESLPDATLDLDSVDETKSSQEPTVTKPYHVGGFQTIYEEDEGLRAQQTQITKIPNRKLQIQRVPLVKPKPPVLGLEGSNQALAAAAMAEANRRKRNSMVSLDESIISADSGVGSSCHYDNLSVSDQASVYFNNMPGTRDTVYMTESMASDVESFGPLRGFFARGTHRRPDSGIESNGDSCDEKLAKAVSNDRVLKTKRQRNTMEQIEDSENIYEVMPDTTDKGTVVRKKKPCVGHHEGVGHSCCSLPMDTADEESLDGASFAVGKLSPSRQCGRAVNKEESEKSDNVEAQWKQLVDTATNTSDHDDSSSLEGDHGSTQDSNPVAGGGFGGKRSHGKQTVAAPPIFTKLEAALLDELLDLRQQNNASRASLARTVDNTVHLHNPNSPHQDAHFQDTSVHCNNCKRMYKRQCEGSSYYPAPSRVDRRRTNSSLKMSSSSSSPSSLYKNSVSSIDGVSVASTPNLGEPMMLTLSGDAVAGLRTSLKSSQGHRQAAQYPDAMRAGDGVLSEDGRSMRVMLETVQKQGKLGFVAGQLVPLLTECWSDDVIPSADDILQRLCEVLPTATV